MYCYERDQIERSKTHTALTVLMHSVNSIWFLKISINSLNFCHQRATDNLIFGSKHDWKIAMLSAWFGAFFSMIGKNCLQDKTRQRFIRRNHLKKNQQFNLTRIIKQCNCIAYRKLNNSCKQFFPIMLKKAPNQADNITIFQSCLLLKMRSSVALEGRYIGY